MVTFDPSLQSPESLAEAIEDMGFESRLPGFPAAVPVPTETTVISLAGLSPESQALSSLSQLRGVVQASVVPSQESLSLTFIPSMTGAERVNEVLRGVALEAKTEPPPANQDEEVLVKIRIDGMAYLSCTATIEGKIRKLNGVRKVKGNSSHQ